MAWVGSWFRYMARLRLAPYVPTPPSVGTTMLELARVRPGEVIVDLGCGDGRLLVQAVTAHGASRAVGYELDSDLVDAARAAAGDDQRIEVRQADVLASGACLAEADVVALYLTERGNAAVLPLLRSHLRASSRVVSYCWPMPGLPPTRTAQAVGRGVVLTRPNVLLWEYGDLVSQASEAT